jgi:serine/threonine-protein kinase RsbT
MSVHVVRRIELPVVREDDIVVVRRAVRKLAEDTKFDTFAMAALTTATSELTRNIWTHAGQGNVTMDEIADGDRRGVRIEFKDQGPGISDVDRALRGGYSSAKSMGLGLSGSRRLVDTFSIETEVGKGTRIVIEKWTRYALPVKAALVSGWLGPEEGLKVTDSASLGAVEMRSREVASEVGLAPAEADALVRIATGLGLQQLSHGRYGEIIVRRCARGPLAGVEIMAADRGAGLLDPGEAFSQVDDSSELTLAGVARLSDELDVDVRVDEGTLFVARKFAAPPPHRSEVGIYGRALVGESDNGDHAAYVRDADGITLMVVDGVGHGSAANEAARIAVDTFLSSLARGDSLVDIVDAADRALVGSRGAAVSIARLDFSTATARHAGAGNVTARVLRSGGDWFTFAPVSRILGDRNTSRGAARVREESTAFPPGASLVVFTDGLTSGAGSGEPTVLRAHPITGADFIARHHARKTDDLLVMVAR